jgi:hypothetical protein
MSGTMARQVRRIEAAVSDISSVQEKARRLAGFFVAGQRVPNGIAFVVMAASLRPYWIWPPPRRITPSMFRLRALGNIGVMP